jgi:hypothetical protein
VIETRDRNGVIEKRIGTQANWGSSLMAYRKRFRQRLQSRIRPSITPYRSRLTDPASPI